MQGETEQTPVSVTHSWCMWSRGSSQGRKETAVADQASHDGSALERSPYGAAEYFADFPDGLGGRAGHCHGEHRGPLGYLAIASGDVGGHESHHRRDLPL